MRQTAAGAARHRILPYPGRYGAIGGAFAAAGIGCGMLSCRLIPLGEATRPIAFCPGKGYAAYRDLRLWYGCGHAGYTLGDSSGPVQLAHGLCAASRPRRSGWSACRVYTVDLSQIAELAQTQAASRKGRTAGYRYAAAAGGVPEWKVHQSQPDAVLWRAEQALRYLFRLPAKKASEKGCAGGSARSDADEGAGAALLVSAADKAAHGCLAAYASPSDHEQRTAGPGGKYRQAEAWHTGSGGLGADAGCDSVVIGVIFPLQAGPKVCIIQYIPILMNRKDGNTDDCLEGS